MRREYFKVLTKQRNSVGKSVDVEVDAVFNTRAEAKDWIKQNEHSLHPDIKVIFVRKYEVRTKIVVEWLRRPVPDVVIPI